MAENSVETVSIEVNATGAGLAVTFKQIGDSLKSMSGDTQQAVSALDKIANAMEKTDKEAERGSFSIKRWAAGFAAAVVGIRSMIHGLKRLYNGLSGLFNVSNEYIEALNLFNVTMGDGANAAMDYAEKVQNAMGIDISQWIENQGVFQQMAEGFGVASDKAQIMSKNLTQLGYDLSSFFNTDVQTAMQKLQSGMSGQVKGLKAYGINLSVAALQETALAHGIDQSVRSMSESERAMLRYVTVMERTSKIQGDMARTIITPANAMRILQAAGVQLRRELGNIVSVIAAKVIPWVMGLVKALTSAARAIAKFFGFELPEIDYSGISVSGDMEDAEDAAGGVAGNLGKAAKSAKKMKDYLMGFDELNVINPDTGAAAGGAGGGAGGGGGIGGGLGDLELPEYDFLKGLKQDIPDLQDKLEKLWKIVSLIAGGFTGWKIGTLVYGLLTGASGFKGLSEISDLLKGNNETTKEWLGRLKDNSIVKNLTWAGAFAIIAADIVYLIATSKRFREGLKVLGEVGVKAFKGIASVAKQTGTWIYNNIPGVKGFADGLSAVFSALDINVMDFVTTGGGLLLLLTGLNPAAGKMLLIFEAITLAIRAVGWATEPCIEHIDILGEGISDVTKQKLEPFLEKYNELGETIQNTTWTNAVITETDVKNIGDKLQSLTTMIIDELDADKNETLKNLEPLKGLMDQKKYDKILESTQKFYDDQKAKIQAAEDEIQQIYQTAADQKRELDDSEKARIEQLYSDIQNIAVTHMSESEQEQKIILARLKDESKNITAETASEIIKNAKKTHDETIKQADDQYYQIKVAAEGMYEAGQINEDEYNAMIEAAQTARDDTVAAAEEQYKDIVETCKTKLGEMSETINFETGEVKTRWERFCDWITGKNDEYLTEVGNTTNDTTGAWQNTYDTYRKNEKTANATWWKEQRENASTEMDNMDTAFSTGTSTWGATFSRFRTDELTKFGTFLTDLWTKIKNFFSGEKWQTLGQDAGKGIGTGLNSTVTTTAQNYKTKLLKKMEEKMDINSPSKVMRDEIGVYLGQGVAVGLEDGFQAMIARSNMTQDLMENLSNKLTMQIGLLKDNITDALDSMWDKVESYFDANRWSELGYRAGNSLASAFNLASGLGLDSSALTGELDRSNLVTSATAAAGYDMDEMVSNMEYGDISKTTTINQTDQAMQSAINSIQRDLAKMAVQNSNINVYLSGKQITAEVEKTQRENGISILGGALGIA